MPNGHGGIPRFGSPLVAAVLTGVFAGWALAFHLTMRDVSKYGGACSSPEERKAATFKYLIASLVLVPAAFAVVYIAVV